MEIETLLNEEIVDEFNRLRGIEVGTPEYTTTVNGLTKLMEKKLEIDKLNAEFEDKAESRKETKTSSKFDQELRLKQIEEEKKDRVLRNCIAVAGIIIPSVITIWGTMKSIEFEKEGTITTIMGRGFINKLLPKK